MPISRRHHWILDYLAAAGIVAACTLLGGVSHWRALTEANIVMIFLAGVTLTAAMFGHGPALAAIGLSATSMTYFFLHPAFEFSFSDAQYTITLGVMVAIGLLISELTTRLQKQADKSGLQARQATQLYQLSCELSARSGAGELLTAAGDALAKMFAGEAVLYVIDSQGSLELRYGEKTRLAAEPSGAATAQRAAVQGRAVQGGDDSSRTSLYAPMTGSRGVIGVAGVGSRDDDRALNADELQTLETAANLVALSLERARSAVEAQEAHTQVETEQLRNSLLASISHDLRSPLATIAVTTQALIDKESDSRISEKRDVLETIVDETRQLGRQVDNLLDWGRLNSAARPLARDWQVLDELVGIALLRLRRELAEHEVRIEIPADFPLLWIADDLMVQVLVNLLNNAARYTPAGSRIEIAARTKGDWQEMVIADNGPGIPAGSDEAVFEKFVRGAAKVADGRRGLGLGLSICRSIVAAHGGTIRAGNRPEGGAEFVISLPCPAGNLAIRLEEAADCH